LINQAGVGLERALARTRWHSGPSEPRPASWKSSTSLVRFPDWTQSKNNCT